MLLEIDAVRDGMLTAKIQAGISMAGRGGGRQQFHVNPCSPGLQSKISIVVIGNSLLQDIREAAGSYSVSVTSARLSQACCIFVQIETAGRNSLPVDTAPERLWYFHRAAIHSGVT